MARRISRFRMVVLIGVIRGRDRACSPLRALQDAGRRQPGRAPSSRRTPTPWTYQSTVEAARGNILDRNGNVLVSNRASYNLVIINYVLFQRARHAERESA